MWHDSEEGESREVDESGQALKTPENSGKKRACSLTETGDTTAKTDIECIQIDEYQASVGCVRTLMMQIGAFADTKRFDVIEQTATPDGFQYVSTVFSDIQKAIDHLRDTKNRGAVKSKRKYCDVEPTNADSETYKASRMSFKRCCIPIVHRR